jgi:hypothetical protein
MKYEIELSENELKEIISKLANELEDYGDTANSELKSSFSKIYQLASKREKDCFYTLLVEKWVKRIGC